MTSGRIAGVVLMATGIASIGLMMVHPRGDASDVLITGVHGSLIIVFLVQAASLVSLLGGHTFSKLQASVFYGAGVLAGIGAGILNGLIYPAIRSYPDGEIGQSIFKLVWSTNQVLAEIGVIAAGIGFALWSVGLWKAGERLIASLGWIAGLLPAALLLSGVMGMDLHGAMAAYALQAAWVIAVGFTRFREG